MATTFGNNWDKGFKQFFADYYSELRKGKEEGVISIVKEDKERVGGETYKKWVVFAVEAIKRYDWESGD